MMGRILTVFGACLGVTKTASLAQTLQIEVGSASAVCASVQHRQMLDQVLKLSDIMPEFDLNPMQSGQTLSDITSNTSSDINGVLDAYKPDAVLVHGDVTAILAASLAAFYRRIPVGHVETGLRTSDIWSSWPEELNRCVINSVTAWHFAPATESRQNLLGEDIDPRQVTLVGNTVTDALLVVK